MLIEKTDLVKIATKIDTHPDRQRRYRIRQGDTLRVKNATRMRKARADHIPTFIGVDSEGIGSGNRHRAVLLGCGSNQYVATDRKAGLQWKEVLEFLYYENFEHNPEDTVYVGFYLSYDFNQWFKSLPEKASTSLFTIAGKEKRRIPAHKRTGQDFYPVRVDGWEIDMLGMKSLTFRPRVCECLENRIKCTHKQLPHMTICDAGPFFQTSFMKVLDDWPKTDTLWTEAEYKEVQHGKEFLRKNQIRVTKAMMKYNALENELLARIMHRIAEGLRDLGIKLRRTQWYGPGAVAQIWLSKNGGIKTEELLKIEGMPEFLDICRMSFYGGWFEIYSHGIIKGESHNYDINSAYPSATTKLPHLCDACRTRRGNGQPKGNSDFVLLHCTVHSNGRRIGAVPHRDSHGSILRPTVTKGWYWRHEIEAANDAGLIKKVEYHEYMEFLPCNHPAPLAIVGDLYNRRNIVGKDTPEGKAIKLIINSIYGKFAQSTGAHPYNNWFYASYITSMCRTQILNAIATHPRKADGVLMVATDGICFDSPHPSLPISKRLGDWSHTTYTDLCLFKPGVYWHKGGKEALLEIKSRGVPKTEFERGISLIESIFEQCLKLKMPPSSARIFSWVDENLCPDDQHPTYFLGPNGWPQFEVHLSFQMITCKQALARGKWDKAGMVRENPAMMQSSDPSLKRGNVDFNRKLMRLDSVIPIVDLIESKPYKDPTIVYPKARLIGFGITNDPRDDLLEQVSTARDKQPNYDIDLDDIEWTTVWDGGPV